MSEEAATKLAVYTVVVRVPKDENIGWSVYAVDTKGGYYDDIVDFSVVEITE